MGKHQLPVNGLIGDSRAVTIREEELGILTQIAGWSRFKDAGEAALRSLSLELPRDYRTPFRVGQSLSVWRIAPDRALVMSESPLGLQSSYDLAVLELSNARVRLVLEGPGAADLLSRLMALDFSEPAFPIGTFVQGSMHRVGVLVDRIQIDRFDLLIPTTWAISLIELMSDHLHIHD